MCWSTLQELTRELVSEKLPTLYAHLTNNCVDIAVITFNWLLAAFVDALPTEVGNVCCSCVDLDVSVLIMMCVDCGVYMFDHGDVLLINGFMISKQLSVYSTVVWLASTKYSASL